jgi:hypothetical protein
MTAPKNIKRMFKLFWTGYIKFNKESNLTEQIQVVDERI